MKLTTPSGNRIIWLVAIVLFGLLVYSLSKYNAVSDLILRLMDLITGGNAAKPAP